MGNDIRLAALVALLSSWSATITAHTPPLAPMASSETDEDGLALLGSIEGRG